MVTPLLRLAVFQLFLLWKLLIVAGAGNSLAVSSSVTNHTASHGSSNQLSPTEVTTSIGSSTISSSYMPSTYGFTTGNTLTKHGIGAGNSLAVSSSVINHTASHGSSNQLSPTEVTTSIGSSTIISSYVPSTDGFTTGDLPFWVYIIIALGVIIVVSVVVIILYTRVDRWKSHGSYMVWDDNELNLSPVFTRESEFLLDNLAADHEPGTPELQIYEIPLDSLGHQRVYIGTTRVAPKSDERKEAVKFTKTKKQTKKDRQDLQGNTLPRAGRRDHIYSSVNDEVSSTLSEGDLREARNINGHTLPTLITSRQNVRKLDSSKPMVNGASSPEVALREIRAFTLGSRTKSVSNLFQNRPLPPAPSKRFSKSLDRLRFFEAVHHNKGKGKTFPYHHKPAPLRTHPVLVKSSSFGGTFNKIVTGPHPPVPPPVRKGSIDLLDKSTTFDMGHLRKSNLCHRHSKSLDTLLLLRDNNWTKYDVDIYHSYASVHSSQSDNNNEKDPSYATVTSDEPPSHDETSGRMSSQSKGSTRSESPTDSDGPVDDFNDENLYASVSDDEISRTGSLPSAYEPRYVDRDTEDKRDSGASSSIVGSEDPASPYASVRISQIPGLDIRPSLGEENKCSEKVFEKEDSGSSIGTCKDLREDLRANEDLKRASTHTYLELLPDSGRESIISETSSGYARPIEVISEKSDADDSGNSDSVRRESLTDIYIPMGCSKTFEGQQSPSEECCSDKEDLPLVSDNRRSDGERKRTQSTERTVQSNPRLSQLSNQGLEEDNEDDAVRDNSTEVHIYQNANFVQNPRKQDVVEQLRPADNDPASVHTSALQQPRLRDEFCV